MTAQPAQAWLGPIQGRVALVTGGTRGIGSAICRQLVAAGAGIAAGYWRGRESAEKFAETIAAEHPGRRITLHEGNIGEADYRRLRQHAPGLTTLRAPIACHYRPAIALSHLWRWSL